jgi:mRNA-degrading endonuclease RelE of RelBE toxin-antitoxin system
MEFRIADTFTDSLARLTGDEQKSVKTTAFDLQINPANPGMSFHKLDKAKDKNFWSVRVSRDIRLIVHKTEASLLLFYVEHHIPSLSKHFSKKTQYSKMAEPLSTATSSGLLRNPNPDASPSRSSMPSA